MSGLHPMEADHTMEERPSIVASQYEAPRSARHDGFVATATLETRLEQLGQGTPTIRVGLRAQGVGRTDVERRIGFDPEVLRLSLTDAEELAAVLSYLVRQAETSA